MLPLLLLGLLATSAAGQSRNEIGVGKLEEVFAWKQLTYNFGGSAGVANRYFSSPQSSQAEAEVVFPDAAGPSETSDGANSPGNTPSQDPNFFIQYNNVPMGVDRWKDKIFITVPRRREGIPATLNYVSLTSDKGTKSPGLRPYPDLAANTVSGQNPLVNVYRTRVDACDRLWFVDIGILEIPGNFRTIQPPALVIYDLKTNTLLRRYQLRSEDLLNNIPTGFASVTVDVDKNDCSSAFAYLTDLYTYGVVVYSLKDNTSWRVNHNFFYFDPEEGDFNLNGLKFMWNDGVFSVALGPVQADGYRLAYFHAMASHRERAVSTAVLRNATLATRTYHDGDFKIIGYKGPATQTTMHSIHPGTSVMFGAQVGSNALSCWNTKKPLSSKTLGIVAQDSVNFMYPSDLKVEQDNVWIMTNRLPMYIYSRLDPEDVNFRLYRVSVANAIRRTVCA